MYVVNRSKDELLETEVSLQNGAAIEDVKVRVINGPDIKAQNSFDVPNEVGTRGKALSVSGSSFVYTFEPHFVTALICSL